MKISTKGRYALRVMIDLAEHNNGEYISLKEISARQGISLKYLEQIISLLSRPNFIKSVRGSKGGYKLSKNPEDYTVGDILRVTEGNLAPISCLEDETNTCERCSSCDTLEFWSGLYAIINDYVDKYTLLDLLNQKTLKH